MYLVKAKNILNNREYKGEFETEIEANEWVNSHINKNTFGKNARQAVREQDSFDESLVLSEFTDTDEDGSERIIVSLKAEYTTEGPTLIDGSGVSAEDKEERLKTAAKVANFVNSKKKFGKTVEGYFSGLVSSRGLSKAQKKQIRKSVEVKSIVEELRLGAIEDALEEINLIVIDNDLFFQEDIDKVKKIVEDFLNA